MTDNEIIFQPDTSQNILTILHRRKMMIVGIFLVCFSTFALLIQGIKPVYMAKAQIAFVGKDEAYVSTQQHYIKSLNMARQVVTGLNLFDDSDFNTQKYSSNPKFKALNINGEKIKTDVISRDHATLLYNVLAPLSASHPADSYVLDLSYTHHDPKRATQILGSFIRHYADAQAIKKNYTKPTKNWRDPLLTALRKLSAVIKSIDPEKTDYSGQTQNNIKYKREKHNFLILKSLLTPFLNENGELEFNSRAPILRKSEVLRDIDQEKKKLERKLANLSLRYGDKHPKIKNIKSKILIITEQINQESEAIMLQLKVDYDQAETRLKKSENKRVKKNEQSISSNYDGKFNSIVIDLSKIEGILSEIESNSALFPPPLPIKPPSIQITSPATTPLHPVFPNKLKLTGTAFILSLLISIIIVVFIERTRKTFLSGRQLENAIKRPCYALIPKIKGDKDKALADYVVDHPGSDVSEAVRALRLNIRLHENEKHKGGKVVMVTSSKPDEGKTTLCAWLGRISAKSGERVLLIDADLRAPCLHTSLGTKNTLSLVDYLAGTNKLEEVIDKDDPSGLHIIYGRSVPSSALDLVSSEKIDKLISSLRKDYDLIIIDTPACMAVSDARALQKYSDLILYVVAWNKTRREVIHNGVSQFTKFDNRQIATVLTNIDVKKHVQLGYGEVVSNYGTYKPA